MLRSIEASATRPRSAFFDGMWRCSRSVQVDVLLWGLVADSFRLSDPHTLGDAMAPIYRHLPQEGVIVRLLGIEEAFLPLGIGRTTRQVVLCDLNEAHSFLDG